MVWLRGGPRGRGLRGQRLLKGHLRSLRTGRVGGTKRGGWGALWVGHLLERDIVRSWVPITGHVGEVLERCFDFFVQELNG